MASAAAEVATLSSEEEAPRAPLTEEEEAALRNWEKEEGEAAVMSHLLSTFVSPSSSSRGSSLRDEAEQDSELNAEREPEIVIADPRDRRFGD